MFGPLLEVEMMKQCAPLLWRQAHFQVKMLKAPHVRTILDDQMSFRVTGARDCAACQKRAKNDGFVAVSTTSTATLHYTPLHCTTTTTATATTATITLHYATLRCSTLY